MGPRIENGFEQRKAISRPQEMEPWPPRGAFASPAPLPPPLSPAEEFYARFDNGSFDLASPFLSQLDPPLRPQNAVSVGLLFERVKADKGEGYAIRVISRYFGEVLKRNPIEWDTLAFYLHIVDVFKRSPTDIVQRLGQWIEGQINKYILDNKKSCPDRFAEVCQRVDQKGSAADKLRHHFATGGAGRVADKLWSKAVGSLGAQGKTGVREEFRMGKIELRPVTGAQPGFQIEDIYVEGRKSAVIITGDSRKGARVGIDIAVGGGATVERVEQQMGTRLVAQFPSSFQHGEKLPPELMIFGGEVVRALPPDPTRHDGYVLVFPDGRLHIVDKRSIALSEITGDVQDEGVIMKLRGKGGDASDLIMFEAAMKRAKASQVPAMLVAHRGRPEWLQDNGTDERRLLVAFGNGTFALISTLCGDRAECAPGGGVKMGINDILMLITRIGDGRGGVVSAVYLDTGHYDSASYYTYAGGKRTRVVIGHPDSTTQLSRMYFYTQGSGR